MARQQIKGLQYFPLDSEFNDKVELLIAECGLSGLGILIKLWQRIYSKEGYYINWGKDNQLLFSQKINSDVKTLKKVVIICLKRNIFSKKMYEKHKILTSSGIQRRYLRVCKLSRRKDYGIITEYSLIITEFKPKITESCRSHVGVMSEFGTQSKVNKSKVNKRKKIKERKNNKNIFSFENMYSVFELDTSQKTHKKPSSYLIKKKHQILFDEARVYYRQFTAVPGLLESFSNFKLKNSDWREVIPKLLPAIKRLEEYKNFLKTNNTFCPEYPLFSTWLNQKRWTEEFPKLERKPNGKKSVSDTPPGEGVVISGNTYFEND